MKRLENATKLKTPVIQIIRGIAGFCFLAMCHPAAYAESTDHFHRWLEVIKQGHQTVGRIENQLESSLNDKEENEVAQPLTNTKSQNKILTARQYANSTRQNRERILRYLKKWVELDVFSFKGERSHHRVYLDSYNQQLVGKHRIGRSSYTMTVSQKESRLDYKLRF